MIQIVQMDYGHLQTLTFITQSGMQTLCLHACHREDLSMAEGPLSINDRFVPAIDIYGSLEQMAFCGLQLQQILTQSGKDLCEHMDIYNKSLMASQLTKLEQSTL